VLVSCWHIFLNLYADSNILVVLLEVTFSVGSALMKLNEEQFLLSLYVYGSTWIFKISAAPPKEPLVALSI
jgi:hypothetical protein